MRQISATTLAKLGKCERQVYFDYHDGEDQTLTAKYIRQGNAEHEKFNRKLSGQDHHGVIRTCLSIIWRLIVKLLWR